MLYHIKTWGCQMNVYDSNRISEILESLNYKHTNDQSEADLIILNTCHIREKATEKVFSELGRLKKLKDRRAKIGLQLTIGVSGCVAQAEGAQILKRSNIVDMVFGPQTWHKLPEMLKKIKDNQKVCEIDFPIEEKYDKLPEEISPQRIHNSSAFLAIQEGCDKFCTYCVVPYTRGSEYSRAFWQVLNEATTLASMGAKEITLLGQNVNAYHGLKANNSEGTLGELISEVAKIPGLERIRYTTSYPAEVNNELIEAHKNIDKLVPFLHLPIQSGSNKILKRMNRKHTRDQYLDIINKLKNAREDMAFSSDFIVGFPNETEQDFMDTVDIIKKVGFIQSFAFMYSPRPGTPAQSYDNQIDKSIKKQRLKIIQSELEKIQNQFNLNTIDRKFSVLLDRLAKKQGYLIGRSPWMQPVLVPANQNEIGTIVKTKIIESNSQNLIGKRL